MAGIILHGPLLFFPPKPDIDGSMRQDIKKALAITEPMVIGKLKESGIPLCMKENGTQAIIPQEVNG